jgi:hypothetical protein
MPENRLRTVYDIRFDPFSQTQGSATIANEIHTIEATGLGFYGIRLNEVPLQENPSSIVIPGYTEITSGEPTANQFKVDYTYKSGYIKFHSSQNGITVSVTYKGTGSPVEAAIVNQHRTNATIDHPDASITNAKLAGSISADKLLSSAKQDIRQQESLGLRLEVRTSDPASPVTGDIWLRSDL